MDETDNNAWVFDSLVGFLHGPVWNVPLQTFTEEKSLLFEPTESGGVLDRPEYKKIHDEYRDLVDVMLGSFMDDIGISTDQFEAACRLSAHDLAEVPGYFHKRLFEQIWAANDYEMFVKMMTHKNVELQLQALELIGQRYGTTPNLFASDSEELETSRSEEDDGWPDNDDVMTEIKKLQLEELENTDETITVPPEDVVAEKHTLLTKLQSFEKKEEKIEKIKEGTGENFGKDMHNSITTSNYTVTPKAFIQKVEVSEEEVWARQQYLKQQRDKLLALKKQVREKRLGAIDSESSAGFGVGEGVSSIHQRPHSARMAKAALAGTMPQPPPDAMQLRRALATKLKTEVVDTHN